MQNASQRLRILHLVRNAFPFRSGYSIRGKTVFESQKAAGLEPVVVSQCVDLNDGGDAVQIFNHALNTINGIDYHVYNPKRYVLGRLSLFLFRLSGLGMRGANFTACQVDTSARHRYVRSMFEATKPHIIHAHTGAGWYGLKLSRRVHRPWVYEMRGFWEDTRSAEGKYEIGSKPYNKTRQNDTKLAMAADAVITISRAMCGDMVSRGVEPKKIWVVPNAVDTSRFVPVRSKDEELLERFDLHDKVVAGYITNIRRLEGLDTLIRAVPIILDRFPRFSVLIVGDGSYRKNLESLVEHLELTSHVKFTGHVDHEMVERFYSILDIFVVPRTNTRVCRMVAPLKPLEAMAMGRAAVVSNVDALTELIKDGRTGLIFNTDDPHSLAEKCVELCLDQDLRKRLAKEAHRWVGAERNLPTMACQYKNLYTQLAQSKRTKHSHG